MPERVMCQAIGDFGGPCINVAAWTIFPQDMGQENEVYACTDHVGVLLGTADRYIVVRRPDDSQVQQGHV